MTKETDDVKDILQDIHYLLAEGFKEFLKENKGRFNEVPASSLQVIVSFLKNNDVTADVKDAGDLAELRSMLTKNKAKDPNTLVKVASGVQDILNGTPMIN